MNTDLRYQSFAGSDNGNGQGGTEKEMAPAEHEGQTTTTTTTTQPNYSAESGCGQGDLEQENGKYVFYWDNDNRDESVDRLIELIRHSPIEIYELNGKLVIPKETNKGLVFKTIGISTLMYCLEKEIEFITYYGNKQEKINCPGFAASILLDDPIGKLKHIEQVVHSPFLCKDGSLLLKKGYYPEQQIYITQNYSHLRIPDKPTKQDAEKAVEVLLELVKEFPITNELTTSAVLSALITSALGPSIKLSPFFTVRAPTRGIGKSVFVDMCSIIHAGRLLPKIFSVNDEEELRKRIEGLLKEKVTFINIDNYEGEIRSKALCTVVTAQSIYFRIMHTHDMPEAENKAIIFINGNNVILGKDLVRRTIVVEFGLPKGYEENPFKRKFSRDIIEYTKEKRNEILEAVITIVKAYLESNEKVDVEDIEGFAGFDDWNKFVREPIVWLGYPDPVETLDTLIKHDQDRQTQINVWEVLLEVSDGEKLTGSEFTELLYRYLEKLTYFINQDLLIIAADEDDYTYELGSNEKQKRYVICLNKMRQCLENGFKLSDELKKQISELLDRNVNEENAQEVFETFDRMYEELVDKKTKIEEVLGIIGDFTGYYVDSEGKKRIKSWRVGHYFARNVNIQVGGYKLEVAGTNRKNKLLWKIVKV